MSAQPTARLATKVARHQRIVQILQTQDVQSQGELRAALAGVGLQVTQATLSRDLDELGAVKISGSNDHLVYRVPPDGASPTPMEAEASTGARARLERVVGELLGTVDCAGNIVVLRTPPGAAQYLASVLDHTSLPEILGTVAGDDTVLAVTRDQDCGRELAQMLAKLSSRRRGDPSTSGQGKTLESKER